MSGFLTLDRAGFIGAICTDLNLNDAADFAAQRSRQVLHKPCPAVKI